MHKSTIKKRGLLVAIAFIIVVSTIGIATQCKQSKRPWQKKTWLAFGTSITATDNTKAPGKTPTGKYPKYLEELSGLVCTNKGIGSACIAGDILYCVHRSAGEMCRVDLITIEGSVNDWISNVPLGNTGDTVPFIQSRKQETVNYLTNVFDPKNGTFAGACYQVFKIAKEHAPHSVIVFLTDHTGQLYGNTDCSAQAKNALGLTQQDYTDMAANIAKSMGLTVIDAGRISTIEQDVSTCLYDQIHHTEYGGQKYAEAIWKELQYISPP